MDYSSASFWITVLGAIGLFIAPIYLSIFALKKTGIIKKPITVNPINKQDVWFKTFVSIFVAPLIFAGLLALTWGESPSWGLSLFYFIPATFLLLVVFLKK